MGIQIVTDSTAYFTKEEIANYDIKVVQLPVEFQGENRDEGFPGEFRAFFEKLRNAKEFPTTSQPAPADFAEVFSEAVEQGKEVIAITVSSKVSGTYNAAVLAANIIEPEKITVIDSLTGVANVKYLVIEAQKMVRGGKSRKEIVDYLEWQKTRTGIYFTVETLENLRHSGRLSSAQALVGSILNVKPIIKLKEGALEAAGKVRGKRRAIKAMIKGIPNEVKKIYIPHVLNDSEAEKMQRTLEKKYPQVGVEITVLGPVIGSHLGIGALGICFVW